MMATAQQLLSFSDEEAMRNFVLEQMSKELGATRASRYGRSIYGVLEAERGDGTEGLVLMVPYRTISEEQNRCGIAYLLTCIRHYKRFKFWARDLVFLVVGVGADSSAEIVEDLEAWLAAYHHHGQDRKAELAVRAGALQAGLSVELNGDEQCLGPYGTPEIYMEGPNGLLPNLDLINTMVLINRHRASDVLLAPQASWLGHLYTLLPEDHPRALLSILGMLVRQAFGWPLYAHGPFLNYRIDSITFALHKLGHAQELADKHLFDKVELFFRSLNNILEHLHQSYFFYLLPTTDTFVSIANYMAIAAMPAAALLVRALLGLRGGGLLVRPQLVILTIGVINYFVVLSASMTTTFLLPGGATILSVVILHVGDLLMRLFLLRSLSRHLSPADLSSMRPLLCLALLLTMSMLMLLNFGYAIFVGFFYTPVFLFGGPNRRLFDWVARLCAPATLLSLALSIGPSWTFYISRHLFSWNAGIPFLVIQPLLVLSSILRQMPPTKQHQA